MANNSDVVNLKRLIDMGKDKGYITYEELNDELPDEVVSSETIDDLMMMFEELDVMVIDEASKEAIEKSKRLKKRQEKVVEKENFRAEVADVATRVSDPVKMYLKEMGSISLLTREGEVEIAKRIEAGEKEALDALLKCRVGIEYIIELGDLLKNGEIKLKDLINDLDDEDSHTQIGERKETMIQLIGEIESLYQDSLEMKPQSLKKGIPAAKKKRIQTKMENHRRKILELISSFKLEKTQIDLMVERLKETVWSRKGGKGSQGGRVGRRRQAPGLCEEVFLPDPQDRKGNPAGPSPETQEIGSSCPEIQDRRRREGDQGNQGSHQHGQGGTQGYA